MQAVFQPVIDLEREAICGYELLARIAGPPAAPPPMWFSAAAKHGLEGALEARIVRAGLAAAARLPPDSFLSINVSAGALLSPQMQAVFNLQQRFDAVFFEVKESEVADEGLQAGLAPFRSAGGRLAVDDMGAGFTSLRHITALKPELLKVHRSVTQRIHQEPDNQAIVASLVTLGSRLDARVVPVGVERVEEAEELKRLDVPLAQGFLFGAPKASIEEIEGAFASRRPAAS